MNQIEKEAQADTASPALDERFMRAAIAYGRRALGRTAPNPAVGALVVRDGVIVGRGLTAPGGRPHAETEALKNAGELARGATMYVSLEPCSHVGVTPPCARAIIEAKIARVVSSLEDPDSRVAGRGHAMLREAGVEVVTGVAAQEARRANIGHILRVSAGRPMVTLKLAETADGFAAGDVHDARLLITGLAANNRVQMMRSTHDAIMIGAATARADDPLMTVRVPGLAGVNPLRVVLDSKLSLPLHARLVATCKTHPLLLLCGPDAPRPAFAALTSAGAEVVELPVDGEGRIVLREALGLLARRGITRLFSEGGPKVGSQLIREGLADEVILFTSPKRIGREGVPSLAKDARKILENREGYELAEDALAGIDRMRIWRRQD